MTEDLNFKSESCIKQPLFDDTYISYKDKIIKLFFLSSLVSGMIDRVCCGRLKMIYVVS
jgi:hypothetical protein